MKKYTGVFNWPQVIQEATLKTTNYTDMYDYALQIIVTTVSHDIRITSVYYPFHFQVMRKTELTIIYPVFPEPTLEPTLEPTTEPTQEPSHQPTLEPTTEPTYEPTYEPTHEPTYEPTHDPTLEPRTN